jgi:hypothetical protein
LARLYWNVGARNVALLLWRLTSGLLDRDCDWLLKCALTPCAYARADAIVLYLPAERLDELRGWVDASAAALSTVLRPGTPPLTLKIGRGLAACHDPGTGESFGQHRCRLIAEAVTSRNHAPHPTRDVASLLAAVCARLEQAGIAPARPYRRRGARTLPWE